jgi:hypothetical protein
MGMRGSFREGNLGLAAYEQPFSGCTRRQSKAVVERHLPVTNLRKLHLIEHLESASRGS